MSLVYNGVPHKYEAGSSVSLMTVLEFVDTFNYDMDKLYIDKFWESLNNNDWIVVDYDMLKWVGYNCCRDRDNKKKYLLMLESSFIAGKDYESVSNRDPRISDHVVAQYNTIIVRAKSFKMSLMLIQTEQASRIRNYFITLEEILLDYMKYTTFVAQHNQSIVLSNTIREYKDKLDTVKSTHRELESLAMDYTPLHYSEYVYILTSKRYYDLNLFKIGKTINPKNRLHTYNTGTALSEDEMFYVCKIPTSDSSGLEKQLSKLLRNFNHQKEWYRIQQKDLYDIVDCVLKQQDELKGKISGVIENQSVERERIPITDLISLTTPHNESENQVDAATIEGQLKCPSCSKEYKHPKALSNHISRNVCVNSLDDAEYKCPKCTRCFTSEGRLNKHSATGCVGRFVCKRCESSFKSQCEYDRHIARVKPCAPK